MHDRTLYPPMLFEHTPLISIQGEVSVTYSFMRMTCMARRWRVKGMQWEQSQSPVWSVVHLCSEVSNVNVDVPEVTRKGGSAVPPCIRCARYHTPLLLYTDLQTSTTTPAVLLYNSGLQKGAGLGGWAQPSRRRESFPKSKRGVWFDVGTSSFWANRAFKPDPAGVVWYGTSYIQLTMQQFMIVLRNRGLPQCKRNKYWPTAIPKFSLGCC